MDERILKTYEKLRDVTAEVADYLRNNIKPENSVKEVLESAEKLVREKGFEPTFPFQVSINEVAAHMTPGPNEDIKIPNNSLVKVDFGVQDNGICTDTAFTLGFGEFNDNLIKAATEAMEAGVKTAGPGVDVSEVANAIAEVVESYDLNVIRELGGHMIQEFVLHGPVFIPTYRVEKNIYEMKPGDVFAIEVFVTTGSGHVVNKHPSHIFSLNPEMFIYLRAGKDVVTQLYNKYKTLPFADRWEPRLFNYRKVTIRQLIRKKIITEYPPLVEKTGAMVAQAEKTVVIKENGTLVIP